MNTTNRNYESLYIVDPMLTDEQVEAIAAKYSKLITDQGGEVQAAGRWDKRRLAYEVMGRREGIFILMYFTGDPAVSKELDRVQRISDDVLRHLITRVEPQHIDVSRIGQPQPTAEAVERVEAEAPAEVAEAEAPAETQAEAPAEEPAAEETAAEAAPVEEQAVEESSEETGGAEPKAEE